ncbi:uncharacterized protein LOC134256691 [Saccostrea cucullata]|uniref:uncharacterized protein LOC134256691 n=1 Tax=Saccostrea cuccullata TaxID=36930 RepID=UPI002ED506D8
MIRELNHKDLHSIDIIQEWQYCVKVNGGQTCLSCRDIPEPIECSMVTQCGEHEQCFVQKYVNYAGHVRYDLGCASNLSCDMIPPSRKTARVISPDDSVVCETCCNDTVICNSRGLCGSQALPEHSGTLCYHCDYQSHPGSCDHIKLCSIDRACYIGLAHDVTSASYHWVSGCALRETKCKSLEMFADNPFCSSCCEGDLCNNRCHRNQSANVCADKDQFCPLLKDRCHTMPDVKKACPATCALCPMNSYGNTTSISPPTNSTGKTEQTHGYVTIPVSNQTTGNVNQSHSTTPSTSTSLASSTHLPTVQTVLSTLNNSGSNNSSTQPPVITIDDCVDAVNASCSSYNLFDICNTTSIYYPWASDHCRKSCGLCHPGVCEDTIPNCDEYNADMCTNHIYTAFVYLHCRKYCHKC